MKYLLPILLLVFLTACSSDDDESLELTADFKSIQNDLFSKSCATSGCHFGDNSPHDLNLHDSVGYNNLVGAVGSTGATLVKPGDPDNSYLINKLEGLNIVDEQMPLNGSPISQKNINAIRQWITDGALDNR